MDLCGKSGNAKLMRKITNSLKKSEFACQPICSCSIRLKRSLLRLRAFTRLNVE